MNAAALRSPGRNDTCPCGSGAKYKRCCAPGGATELSRAAITAQQYFDTGRLSEAHALCERVLAHRSGNAPMLHLLGAIALRRGQQPAAFDALSAATRAAPDDARAHNDLGVACLALKRLPQARDAFLRALAINPGQADGHNNLGIALKELGDYTAAEASYRSAIALDHHYASARYNLGSMLLYLGRIGAALEELQHALRLKPVFPAAQLKLAVALGASGSPGEGLELCRTLTGHAAQAPQIYWQVANDLVALGHQDSASAFLAQCLQLDPDNRAAAQLLAACGGGHPDQLDAGYVRSLFDEAAERFDAHLVEGLSYRVPQDLAQLAASICTRMRPWDVVDLGCGTGLVGSHIARYAHHLHGIDLSPKMLGQARKLGLYQRLECADVLESMRAAQSSSVDVIVAADVFIYIGRLEEITFEAKRLLRPGGVFAFSVEAVRDAADTEVLPFHLDLRSRRYTHADDYLDVLASSSGFLVRAIQPTELRTEGDRPVQGRLLVWEAPAS